MVLHEQYRLDSVYHDIALIFTKLPFQFDEQVQPVCLAREYMGDKYLSNVMGTLVGFGTFFYGGPVPDFLQEAKLPMLKNADCGKKYHDFEHLFPLGITASLLCAGFEAGGVDACQVI